MMNYNKIKMKTTNNKMVIMMILDSKTKKMIKLWIPTIFYGILKQIPKKIMIKSKKKPNNKKKKNLKKWMMILKKK